MHSYGNTMDQTIRICYSELYLDHISYKQNEHVNFYVIYEVKCNFIIFLFHVKYPEGSYCKLYHNKCMDAVGQNYNGGAGRPEQIQTELEHIVLRIYE